MRYCLALKDGTTIYVEANSKSDASTEALKRGLLSRLDFFEINYITEVGEISSSEKQNTKHIKDKEKFKPYLNK